jgi:3-hydroxyacyl-[acyl-carrier-protein] dehydratase
MIAMNTDDLVRAARRQPLFLPADTTRALALGRREIEGLLPHRPPFLFVDRVVAEDTTQGTLVAEHDVDPAAEVFQGHFPGHPVFPGVLLVEAMAQTGACLLNRQTPPAPGLAYAPRLLKVHHAVFLAPVSPGDRLQILVKRLERTTLTASSIAQVRKNDPARPEICAVAVLEAYLPSPARSTGGQP